MDFTGKHRIITALNRVGDIIVREAKKELIRQNKNASGELLNSVSYVVQDIMNGVSLTEKHIFYGDFVERGRRKGGKKVPIEALERWIEKKNFSYGITKRSLAFAIQTNIHKFGIKPSKWLTNTVNNKRQEIFDMLNFAVKDNFTVIIKEIAKDARRRL